MMHIMPKLVLKILVTRQKSLRIDFSHLVYHAFFASNLALALSPLPGQWHCFPTPSLFLCGKSVLNITLSVAYGLAEISFVFPFKTKKLVGVFTGPNQMDFTLSAFTSKFKLPSRYDEYKKCKTCLLIGGLISHVYWG